MAGLLAASNIREPTLREMERLRLANDPRIARERERLVLQSMADRRGGVTQPGVRHWIRYTIWGRRINPIVPVDAYSPRHEQQAAEDLLMDFALWLVYCKPTGRNISPKTARKYVSQVQGWHRKQPGVGHAICGGGRLERLAAMIKGLRKEVGDAKPRRRFGVRTQHLAAALQKELGDGSARSQNWRAALTVAFCGLLRGGEFATQDDELFNPSSHLTRSDVRFFRADGVRHAAVTIRQLKSNVSLKGKTVEVVLRGGGTLFDPVEELWQLFKLDYVEREQRSSTPLFREQGTTAFTVGRVREMVKLLMASVGCDPRHFGAHSLRIGGATAALSAGIEPAVIRTMGRWSSEIYEIYMRLTRETATRLSSTIASTPFHDLERGFETEALDEAAEIPEYEFDFDDDGSGEDEGDFRED